MNSKEKTKMITDGALISSIYLVFLLLSRFMFSLEEMLFFLIPLPLSVFAFKYSFTKSLIPLISITVLSFILINPLNALFYIMPGLLIGSILGQLMKKDCRFIFKLFVVFLGALLVNLLTSVVFAKLLDYDLFEDMALMAKEIENIFLSLNLNIINFTLFNALLTGLIPSIIVVSSLLEAVVIIFLGNILFAKLKLTVMKKYHVISVNSLPRIIGVIYIALFIGVIVIIPNYLQSDGYFRIFYNIVINIMLLSSLIMIYQGVLVLLQLSIVMKKRWVYIVGCLSIFIFPPFTIILGLIQNLFHINQKINSHQ